MRRLLSAVAVLVSCGAFAGPKPGEVLLRDATVVLADCLWNAKQVTESWGRAGAEDLRDMLAKITGGNIGLVRESEASGVTGPRLYMGPTEAAVRAGLDPEALGSHECRFRCDGKDVYLVARTGVATSWAMTEFLQRFADFYWLSIDAVDPYRFQPDLSVGVCDFRRAPMIPLYETTINAPPVSAHPDGSFAGSKWMHPLARRARQDFGGTYVWPTKTEADGDWIVSKTKNAPSCHSLYYYVPPKVYAKDHPEYYSMTEDGTRKWVGNGGSQLCFTNPDVRDIVTAKIFELVEADKAAGRKNRPLCYDLTQMDACSYLCFCPECKKVIAKYNRKPGGHAEGGDAGLLREWICDIAGRVAKRHPEVKLRTFAYVSTEVPPMGEDLTYPDNVIIWICDLYGTSCHSLPLNHPFNRKRLEIFEGWRKLAKNFMIWDYMLYRGFDKDGFDLVADAVAWDAKYFHDIGVRYLFTQHGYQWSSTWELSAFVQYQSYFGTDKSVDELVKIFCRRYGKAADEMERYYNRFREMVREYPPKSTRDWFPGHTFPWNTDRALVEELIALAERAHDAAGKGTHESARIAQTLGQLYQVVLPIYKTAPGCEPQRVRVRKALFEAIDEWSSIYWCSADGRAKMRKKFRNDAEIADMTFKVMPKELEGVSDRDIYCFDYHQFGRGRTPVASFDKAWCAAQTFYDPTSERGASFRYKPRDGKPLKWPLSGGLLHAGGSWAGRGYYDMFGWEAKDIPADGKWHWVKVRTAARFTHSTGVGLLWESPKWLCLFGAKDCAQNYDGMEYDPNVFDIWAAVRTDAKTYVDFDRVILRRVPEDVARKVCSEKMP